MNPQHTSLTFGSGGITDPNNPQCLEVTRMAMEARIWFHVANYGGGVYQVLRKAFAQAPSLIPRCIVKLDGQSPKLLRASLEEVLRETDIARVDIGQICGNPTDESFRPTLDAIRKAQEEGLIGSIIMDVIKTYGPNVEQALDADLFDGYIFYYNVMEREIPQALHERMLRTSTPVYAMRTFGGRGPHNLFTGAQDNPRRKAIEAIFKRSDCPSRVDFCIRFPLSRPQVITTIGSTANPDHFAAMLDATNRFEPLPPSIVEEIEALHENWSTQ